MTCSQTEWLSDAEFLRRFRRRAVQERVPLLGSLELTRRCNLRCVHCYLGPQAQRLSSSARELSTAQAFWVIDQVVANGCLNLLLTGGDPLLRPDFAAIYARAKLQGLLVTVFTNGTLVNDPIVEIFRDLPPRCVEISLYGATATTYEKITRVPGSFQRCLSGIERLLKASIDVRLKTVLITLNQHELDAIAAIADGYGVPFRLDLGIFPCLDGSCEPTGLRVPPAEAIRVEMADPVRRQRWQNHCDKFGALPASDQIYQCGAGLTSFHVNAFGDLQPCLMVADPHYSLLAGDFATGWHTSLATLHQRRTSRADSCASCSQRGLCGYCPGFFALENGDAETKSAYLCAVGHQRLAVLRQPGT